MFINIFTKAKEYVYSKYAYGVVIALGFFLTLELWITTDYSSENFNIVELLLKSLTILVVTAIICLWFAYIRKYPKFKKDTTGILLVIDTYDATDRALVEKYFVSEIRNTFRHNYNYDNEIIFLDPFHTKNFVSSSEEKQLAVIHQMGAKLTFWGECKSGSKNGETVHFIDLNSIITHDKLHIKVSERLSWEMTTVMQPLKKLYIYERDNISGFKSTSQMLNLVSDFIMASALYYTCHFDESIVFFEKLQEKLHGISRNLPSIAVLKHIVPIRCRENYLLLANGAYYEYRETADKMHLTTMKQYLDKYSDLELLDCPYYEGMAIYHFCYNRDIKKAKECVSICKNSKYNSFSYKFDEVFLKLYERHTSYCMIDCFKKYSAILKKNPAKEIVNEVEEFIAVIVETEPKKMQLYWLLSLLANYREDYVLSQKYLQSYKDSSALEPNEDLSRYIQKLETANRLETFFI